MKVKGGFPIQRLDNNTDWLTYSRYSLIADMKNTAPNIEGLLNALKDPIRTAIWKVDPGDAGDSIAKFVEDWLFNVMDFYEVLDYALMLLEYGYMVFEKEYVVQNGKDYIVLHPRMPFSIIYWNLDRKKGKIISAIQQVPDGTVEIPAKKLFIIINEREGLTPIGKSVLRSLYKNFVLSSEIEEAAAIGLKRNLMGVPVANYPDTISEQDEESILEMLKSITVSDRGYFAEKGDVTFRFQAVEGSLPDPHFMLDYFRQGVNESQSAGMLSLSTSNRGSRAVGSTLAPPFYNRIDAIAKKIAHSFNSLIKEVVTLNFNTQSFPKLVASGISAKDITEKIYALSTVRDMLAGYEPQVAQYILNALEIPFTEAKPKEEAK